MITPAAVLPAKKEGTGVWPMLGWALPLSTILKRWKSRRQQLWIRSNKLMLLSCRGLRDLRRRRNPTQTCLYVMTLRVGIMITSVPDQGAGNLIWNSTAAGISSTSTLLSISLASWSVSPSRLGPTRYAGTVPKCLAPLL